MDARLNPAEFLGLGDGDAHVIRNAGGSANDGINSIVVSQRLLGTQNIAVIHHTDCGMATFTPPLLHAKVLAETPGEAAEAELNKLEFRTFTDLDQSVREDVSLLQGHPLVFTTEGSVSGWVYETSTGKVRRVV
ncbi:hypothetical protein SERLA73DRAFT_92656 [Serpula lacrymans var. lacrymans S7.3]|uniref:Carbonic anhydrase n=2 Tax=Serpula lacrymans var. lacrymans TaxID=341189 RepID=F8Q2V5_SERL3|nr:uncharacterized protein SERLADRAFT_356985 [Serpula lacrymans var. lacrymans S7.9]EGN97516.1 hypothetical protein SERLA73DRAFT_92656 [Serpula lacrymans var. lacrymans S7.3]EGO23119.1 hypothetical protein SERLADRAFT_356985 [Serpula lacrymans var. lacrymans S7.9]